MDTQYNLDINPEESTRRLYPAIQAVFSDNPLRSMFDDVEEDAQKYKSRYWFLTRVSLCFITIGVFATIAEALLGDTQPGFSQWIKYSTIIGVLGLAIEFYVIVTHVKEKWLLNRLAAEILRSFVAQLYALGACAQDSPSFKSLVDEYNNERIADINGILNKGAAAFRLFNPVGIVVSHKYIDTPDNDVYTQCSAAYERLRVNFQRHFVETELGLISASSRTQNSLSDITFLLGALSAVSGGIFLSFEFPNVADWVSDSFVLVGSALFFSSAMAALLGLGNGNQATHGRYAAYLNHISRLERPATTPEGLVKRIELMELEAMRELDAFCVQFDSVSLRI